jgi:hypothetical protein
MHPSTVRTGILGLRRLSLPTQQPFRRAASSVEAIGVAASGPLDSIAGRYGDAAIHGDINGIPARVFDLSSRGARVELTVPVNLSKGTLRIEIDGATFELIAHVKWYRRHPDGPAAYGLEFAEPDRLAHRAA